MRTLFLSSDSPLAPHSSNPKARPAVRRLFTLAAFLIVAPATVPGQNPQFQPRSEGYLFLGVGSGTGQPSMEHVGGGGEVLLFRGLGVGGELGAMGRPGDEVGLYSLDLSYHFFRARGKSKLVPFIEGGYTGAFGNRGSPYPNILNFGGGVHYWVFKHVGLRLEFRDYVALPAFFAGTGQYWGFRVGLALR